MDAEDMGEGWVQATRGGSQKLHINKTGLTIGRALLRQASLTAGDRAEVLVQEEQQRIWIKRDEGGNKISASGESKSGNLACASLHKKFGVSRQRLDVISVEDGHIIAEYD